jgi:Cyclin, N-terminal domain
MNIFDRFLLYNNRQCPIIVLHDEDHDEYDPPGFYCYSRSVSPISTSSSLSSSSACRCPSCKRILDSRTYQLAAMTSLYLAIKLHTDSSDLKNNHGSTKRTFRLESFVELSRGQFVPSDICAMEQTILSVTQWRVHPPTPMLLCSYMLATLLPTSLSHPHHNTRFDLVLHVLRELSRYLTELAVCLGRERLGKTASQVAFCAIVTAMELLTLAALPLSVRDYFYRECVNLLGGTGPDAELSAALQTALWPELLFDEKQGDDDSGHPISMARDFGLLDMDRVYNGGGPLSTRANTPIDSPKRKSMSFDTSSLPPAEGSLQQCSPVSVTR